MNPFALLLVLATCVQTPQIKNSILMPQEHTITKIHCYELDHAHAFLHKKIKGISKEQEQDTRWIATQAYEKYIINCNDIK